MSQTPQHISRASKPEYLQKLINEALYILDKFGMPLTRITQRRKERIAMAFLAVANVKQSCDWIKVDLCHALGTREIIRYWNNNFYENISESSYNDIKRKDLRLIVLAEIIHPSAANPNAARTNSTRQFALNREFATLIKAFGSENWENNVTELLRNKITLKEQLSDNRNLDIISVMLPSEKSLIFSSSKHNELQKTIIEDFLPRYGYSAEVLYVGDTAHKILHLESDRLKALNFFELSDGELPDVIAYSKQKNWLYLIEAVHSSGVISPIRLLELQKLTKQCQADIIFVTAFLNRDTFRKFASKIAWETEVWIADAPDHIIHFNGDKFLGSYSPK